MLIGDRKDWDAKKRRAALAVAIAVVLNGCWCCCQLALSLMCPKGPDGLSVHRCRSADRCRYLNYRHQTHRCQPAMAVMNLRGEKHPTKLVRKKIKMMMKNKKRKKGFQGIHSLLNGRWDGFAVFVYVKILSQREEESKKCTYKMHLFQFKELNWKGFHFISRLPSPLSLRPAAFTWPSHFFSTYFFPPLPSHSHPTSSNGIIKVQQGFAVFIRNCK